MHLCFFFFSSRRRHTRLQGDWSSDVCSSDLLSGRKTRRPEKRARPAGGGRRDEPLHPMYALRALRPGDRWRDGADRKSTRLNSSHLVISYAVFCLKKKNK